MEHTASLVPRVHGLKRLDVVVHLIYTSFELSFLVHQPAHLSVHGCLLLGLVWDGKTSSIVAEALRIESTMNVGVVDATMREAGVSGEVKVR